MNNYIWNEIVPATLFFCFVLFVTGLFWFRPYTGLTRRQGLAALLGAVLVCGYRILAYFGAFEGVEHPMPLMHINVTTRMILQAGGLGTVVVFATALALRLWGRWVGNKATPEEKLPGLPGVRAWFCPSNVAVGALVVVCWGMGDGFPVPVTAFFVAALLAAGPLLKMELSKGTTTTAPVPEDLSPEREKIVSMLEAGKLTADESAELLQALGATKRAAPPPPGVALTGGQRLMLIGAAVLMVGFFLPWLSINPGKEVSRALSNIPLPPGYVSGVVPQPPGYESIVTQLNTMSFSTSGGDIPHGLGWFALGLGLAAALLPYVAGTLEAETSRMARTLCLGIGGFILLYLLTENIRFVGIGLIAAVAGYSLLITGLLPDWRRKAA